MSNKLAYLKSARQRVTESISYNNSIGTTVFKDKHIDLQEKGLPIGFKHSWALLAHMNDLRLWTIAYAPSKTKNLERMQDVHRINNEAIYMIG